MLDYYYAEYRPIRPSTGSEPQLPTTLGSVVSSWLIGLHWPARPRDPVRILNNHFTRSCREMQALKFLSLGSPELASYLAKSTARVSRMTVTLI